MCPKPSSPGPVTSLHQTLVHAYFPALSSSLPALHHGLWVWLLAALFQATLFIAKRCTPDIPSFAWGCHSALLNPCFLKGLCPFPDHPILASKGLYQHRKGPFGKGALCECRSQGRTVVCMCIPVCVCACMPVYLSVCFKHESAGFKDRPHTGPALDWLTTVLACLVTTAPLPWNPDLLSTDLLRGACKEN